MKQSTLFCPAWWWCFLLFPLLLLIILLVFRWSAIEKNVASNARNALQSEGLAWAEVETYNRGRDVLLSGLPNSSAEIDRAVAVVANSYGVRRVDVSGDVQAPKLAPQISYRHLDGKLSIKGEIANQVDLDQIRSLALSQYDADQLEFDIALNPDRRSDPSLLSSLTVFLSDGFGQSSASLEFGNDSLVATASVDDDASKEALLGSLSTSFKGQIIDRISVVPPVVERDVCQDLVNEILQTGKINFESGKAIISDQSTGLLDSLVATAARCPDARFEIAGHTDSVGNSAFNRNLSEKRAQAVLTYLIDSGLSDAQFEASGYGDTQPIADNQTAEGRARNRRIEFRLRN